MARSIIVLSLRSQLFDLHTTVILTLRLYLTLSSCSRMPSADTGSAFSEGTTERILFTSESVGEGHPGDLTIQRPSITTILHHWHPFRPLVDNNSSTLNSTLSSEQCDSIECSVFDVLESYYFRGTKFISILPLTLKLG